MPHHSPPPPVKAEGWLLVRANMELSPELVGAIKLGIPWDRGYSALDAGGGKN